MKYLIIVFILFNGIIGVELRKCTSNDILVRCVSNTEYQFCIYGNAYGSVYDCGSGKVCRANRFPYCLVKNDYFVPMKHTHESNTTKRRKRDLQTTEICFGFRYEHLESPCNISKKFALVPFSGCKLYTICVDVKRVILAECPEGSFFDGNNCSNTYKCPYTCQSNSRNNIKSISVYSILGVLQSGFKRWPVSGSSCRRFIEYRIDENFNTVAEVKECLPNSWFDPHLKYCRMDYYCQDIPHTVIECEGERNRSICNPELHIPHCKSGRKYLQNIPGSGCHYYLSCDLFPPKVIKCPDGELFNNLTGRCESNYICPNPCELYEDVIQQKPLEEYPKCSFVHGNKSTGPVGNSYCSKYVECVAGKEPVIKSCRINMFYNPVMGVCRPDYKCPEYICVPL